VDLNGKVALVTGGGTGIGRAISLELARRGAGVGVNYARSREEAEGTAREIEASGGRALAVQADVSRQQDVTRMVEAIVATFGGIDLLVNNAGTTHFIDMRDLDAVTDEVWDAIFAVNLKGAFYCARAVAPYMRARGAGAICNISSDSSLSGEGSSLPYAVSKAAINGLTRSLARALAPEIRVSGVAPGWVITRWVTGREAQVEQAGKDALLGRNVTPHDVATMVCALLGQEGMTGQTVVVNGG
jgi:3-oxoacyl-[acyl-carrier protein] reductase